MLLKVPTVTVFFLLLSTYILMFLQYAHNNNLCSLFRSVFFVTYSYLLYITKKKREVTPYAHSPIFTNTKHIDTLTQSH